jgi:hypothetical protein
VDVFEELGQLARQHHLARGAEDLQHGLHGLDDAVRGFVEHQRGLQRDQFLQGGFALAGLGRQEADEVEAGIGQARGRQGRHRRRGTGQGDDLEPCGAHGVHYTGTGVGDGRRTGVRDQGHALAGLQAFDDLGGGFTLVVFVGRQQLLGESIALQQLAGIAVSSQATASAMASTCRPRRVMSQTFPMGVASTYNADTG